MKKELTELADELYAKVVRIAGTPEQPDWFNRSIERAYKKYGVPRNISADILNGTKKVDSQFLGFVFANVLDEHLVNEFFTDSEIAVWKSSKYQVDVLTEIKLPMLQVAPDQWIGATDLRTLIQIDDHHLMRYNENTQRVLRKKTYANGDEVYEPYINQQAVSQIYKLLENETYIPNTITFNVIDPDLIEYRNGTFIMEGYQKDTPIFDILDGYHRFRAMKRMHLTNPDFNYPMELRIVSFSEERAKQFIWQEDQKTKMRRIDSKVFNQAAPENRIIRELNDSGPFRGLLTTTGKTIDTAVFAAAMKQVCFKRGEQPSREKLVQIRKRFNDVGVLLEDKTPEMFDRPWTTAEIVGFIIAAEEENLDIMAFVVDYAGQNNLLVRKSDLKTDINKILGKLEGR